MRKQHLDRAKEMNFIQSNNMQEFLEDILALEHLGDQSQLDNLMKGLETPSEDFENSERLSGGSEFDELMVWLEESFEDVQNPEHLGDQTQYDDLIQSLDNQFMQLADNLRQAEFMKSLPDCLNAPSCIVSNVIPSTHVPLTGSVNECSGIERLQEPNTRQGRKRKASEEPCLADLTYGLPASSSMPYQVLAVDAPPAKWSRVDVSGEPDEVMPPGQGRKRKAETEHVQNKRHCPEPQQCQWPKDSGYCPQLPGPSSSGPLPPPLLIPKYVFLYTKVTSLEQKTQYNQDLKDAERQMRKIYRRNGRNMQFFSQEEAQLRVLVPGSKKFQERFDQLQQDFAYLVNRNKDYIPDCNKYNYLKDMVAHITQLVQEFDQQ